MATNILGIGQSALMAAQAGLATTGHNIANAATPGYNRQVVIQTSAGGQNQGFGFIGSGAQISDVRRVYNEYLAGQVATTQSSASQLETYYSQINQINNQFADSTSGVSPTLQNFFAGVQALAADPNSTASRESMLSSAQSLASRVQSMAGQLSEMQQGVNTQITSTIGTINAYAAQISSLNEAIAKAEIGNEGHLPNDLLDQRDQVIADLSKQVQVSIVKQDSAYNVFIGNGQPLVVGTTAYNLVPTASTTDLSRIQVGYSSNGQVQPLPESAFTGGGVLGGLFDFRAKSLDLAQNSLGRIAVGLALTFNAQHELGQDQHGALGRAFFDAAAPLVQPNSNNTGSATLSATITNANALTTSDYRLQFDGASYRVTRLSDNTVVYPDNAAFPAGEIDGLTFSATAGMAAGDDFVIKPTVNGASGFGVAINDNSLIAAAAPLRTSAAAANIGTGKISPSVTTSTAVDPSATLTYAGGNLTGFPAGMAVTVISNGVSTVYAAGAPVGYVDGATISYGGVSFTISGAPNDGDTFSVAHNTNGVGDNRNAVLLGALQQAKTLGLGTTSFQGAYAQLVSAIGNKTGELKVTSEAESSLYAQAVQRQQSESGVNLDEEATNMLRYQQAYEAAGKLMQTASRLFDLLLSLGG